MQWEPQEYKDMRIITDTRDSDDPGFCINESGPTFVHSDASILDDHVMQQRVFDRLPLSHKSKQEFYNWLVTEYAEEQEAERSRKTSGRVKGTKRQRCSMSSEDQC